MSRSTAVILRCAWLGVLSGVGGVVGCGDTQVEERVTSTATVDLTLLDTTWPVQVANATVLDGLVAEAGWQAYYGRDYVAALEAFKDDPALATRIHSEIAAVYRNALMVQTGAIVETYKPEEKREGDPVETDYLLGVSYMIEGNTDLAGQILGQMSESSVEMVALNDASWATLFESGTGLTGEALPGVAGLGDVEVGTIPSPSIDAPHFHLPETVGDRTVAATDPTVLAELAAWHQSAALMAGGNSTLHCTVWGSDCSGEANGEVTLSDIFLSPWMNADDLSFVSAIGSGVTTEELFSIHDSSVIAVTLSECVTEDSVEVECVQGKASSLRAAILDRMNAVAGEESADFRDLAQLSEVGVIRAAIRLSEMVGDEQSSGLLRIGALEAERPPTLDPIFQLEMAAWDVGNRNPRRASELLHVHENRLAGLDSARYSLDALNLRVSRDAGAGLPMH